jgi:hypothetical protein
MGALRERLHQNHHYRRTVHRSDRDDNLCARPNDERSTVCLRMVSQCFYHNLATRWRDSPARIWVAGHCDLWDDREVWSHKTSHW